MSNDPVSGFAERSQAELDGLYERDFFAWTQEQARLLRERRFDELDLQNLIDEVESVGRSERREIASRLEILLAHLLKWRFQPGLRTPSWRRTIRDQRTEIRRVLNDNPSLRSFPSETLNLSYAAGCHRAADETGIDASLFPEECPFTIDQVLNHEFLPKEVGLLDQS
ncbi:MAG: DUF29 domain-containing protein [Bauldia sp.]|nr:DUF29 domain-containing protein [Bauldia sp.]